MTDVSPLHDLRLRTPRLELRLGSREDVVELGRLAANLNQLQRAINRGQAEGVPAALVEELRQLLHEVRQALVGRAACA